MVLNCCEGASATSGANSMAFRMVSEGGIPAAIGMHEPVQVREANAFSASLYPELFGAFEQALRVAPGAEPVRIDLTRVMTAPRRALRHASGRWTLPALYVQDRPLEVFRPVLGPHSTGQDSLQDQLQALDEKVALTAGMLRSLPPETPERVRELILATLDEAPVVPPVMRPDRYGNVGGQREEPGHG